jgi:hypothetical protein
MYRKATALIWNTRAVVWKTYAYWAAWVGTVFFAVYPCCNWISTAGPRFVVVSVQRGGIEGAAGAAVHLDLSVYISVVPAATVFSRHACSVWASG